MPINQEARDALLSLEAPPGVRIVRIDAEDYTDSDGEPAIRVLVVLDESVDVESLTGDMIGRLKAAIREALRQHDVLVFPYVFLAKESELQEIADEG